MWNSGMKHSKMVCEKMQMCLFSKSLENIRRVKSMEETSTGPWPSQFLVSQCLAGVTLGRMIFEILARTNPNIWSNLLSQGLFFGRTSLCGWDGWGQSQLFLESLNGLKTRLRHQNNLDDEGMMITMMMLMMKTDDADADQTMMRGFRSTDHFQWGSDWSLFFSVQLSESQ